MGGAKTPRERDTPWTRPAKELVLYQHGQDWRFAVAYELDIADGRLSVQCETPTEAQDALLALVEDLTDLRYSVSWRSEKPGWWTGTLSQQT